MGLLIPALSAALLALLVAVELGHINPRLPFPPGVEYDWPALHPPPGSLPLAYDRGFRADNADLARVRLLLAGKLRGVETVAAAPDGRLGLVDKFGRIFIASPDGRGGYSLPEQPLAWSSPGRSLGAKFGPDGSLFIANAPLGLLQLVAPGGGEDQKLLLATGRVSDSSPLRAGFPVEFANGLDIAADGSVYLSVSSDVIPYKTADGSWDCLDSVYVTIAKAAPAGMLLAYDPADGSTTALMEGLWFANGVALAPDESFVLVADSVQMKVHRYWLKGPKAGSSEVWRDNLPGPPDGLSRASGGGYWLSIYSAAPGIVRLAHSRLVRLLFAWAPRLMRLLRLSPPRSGLLLRLDAEGNTQQVLADPSGRTVWGVTSATEAGGRLFLGSLHAAGVPVLDLAELGAAAR